MWETDYDAPPLVSDQRHVARPHSSVASTGNAWIAIVATPDRGKRVEDRQSSDAKPAGHPLNRRLVPNFGSLGQRDDWPPENR